MASPPHYDREEHARQGTALYEQYIYDSEGQLLTGSYMDYLIPTAMEVPELIIGHQETPSPFTVHGIKGGGEAGRRKGPIGTVGIKRTNDPADIS